MEEGSSTEYCSNCKRDIPSINYVMHVNHCQRNITLCKHCEEPVPTSQLEEHFDESHVKVKCVCGESLEKMDLEEHKEKSCACRSVTCEFCELSLPSGEMQSHKEYCGSRTEKCEKCNKYIKFRDLEEHSHIDCELMKAEVPNNRAEDSHSFDPLGMLRAMGLTDHNDQDMHEEGNNLSQFAVSQELMKVFHMGNFGTPPVPDPYAQEAPDAASFHNRILIPRGMHPSTSRTGKYEPRRRLKANNRGPIERDGDNPFYTTKLQNNSKAARSKPSATNEGIAVGPREHGNKPLTSDVHEPFQQDDDSVMSNMQDQEESSWLPSLQSQHHQVIQSRVQEESIAASFDETHLPCEFCNGMFPATDLILHQSGCQLLLLDPSLSHPSHSLSDHSSRPWQPTESQLDRDEDIDDEEVHNDMEPISQSDEETFLPCEFCQVQLPVHALFHHQATCEIRPPSALPSSDPPDVENIRHHAQMRPRLSRPARPVHTRALDTDSDDEEARTNNGTAEAAFNKDSTGPRYARKQINRDNDLRNDADYSRDSADPSNTSMAMSKRAPNKSLQRSTSNDLSSLPNELSAQSRKNKTRNSDFSRQSSDSQLTGPSCEEKARDVRPPRNLLSTAAVQKPQQKIRKTKENTSMMDGPGPTRSMRTGSKAHMHGNDVQAASSRKPGARLPVEQPSTASKSLQATSPIKQTMGKTILSKENPRRAGARTFDLDEVVHSEAASRRSQPTNKKKPRKKIA